MRTTVVAFCLLCGCYSDSNQGLSSLANANISMDRMTELKEGMSQKQVLKIMRQPFRYESFKIDKDVYDAWFYITHPTVLGQTRMVHQNLFPLAFKNGILIGWGYRFYDHFKEASQEKESSVKEQQAKNSSETPPPKEEEEPPPDAEGREMLEDDAEDDFNTW